MDHAASKLAFSSSEVYERFMVPAVFAPWAEELLSRAELGAGERVLDVGCGTGIVSRTAATIAGATGTVTGLDINPAMLAVARSQPIAKGAAPITWIEGSAEELPLPDQAFDLVACQQVLQFLPDRPRALGEVRRVLTPGGRVALAAFAAAELHPIHMAFDEVIARHLGRSALKVGFSLSEPNEIRALLEQTNLTVRSIELVTKISRFPLSIQSARNIVISSAAGIPSFREAGVAERQELVERIGDDFMPILRAHSEDSIFMLPWHAHIAIAVK